jgi:hypothetical protein
MKFKSDIEVQAGLKDSSGALGLSGQILSSTSGNVSWVTPTVNTVARDVQNEVKAGVAINKGQAVYVTGADGTNIIVGLASNATEATSSKTLGLLNATVAVNGFADVVQIGRLSGLNTLGATAGDPVWLGTGGNLIYGLINKPYAPAHLVFIGIVTRVNVNNGEIFVSVQNGFELNEIHDVDLKTTVPINGDILGYDGTLWVNKTIAQWLGYIPANASGTTNYVSKFTGTTTLGNSQLFDNGSAVGINTNSPGFITAGRGVLSINGSSSSILEFQTGGSFKSYLYQSGSIFEMVDVNAIAFTTNNSERMRIISNGNVGIGTTAPVTKLDVQSAAAVVGPTLKVSNTNTGGGNLLQLDRATNSRVNGINFSTAGVEDWSLGVLRNGGSPTQVFSLSYQSGSNINSTGFAVTSAGNVGIGIISPADKLEVSGTGNVAIRVRTSTNTGSDYAGLRYVQDATEVAVTYTNLGNYITSLGGTERMRITSAGNIGIGTSSPGAKLDVYGDTFGRGVIFGLIPNTSTQYAGFTYGVNSSVDGFLFLKNGGGNVVGISAAGNSYFNGGNVGIGTSSPARPLSIVSNSPQIRISDTTSPSSNWWEIYSTFSNTNQDLFIGNQNGNAITINASRNVGIGNTNPQVKLDINRGVADTNTPALYIGDNTNTLAYVPYTSSGGYNTLSTLGGSILFNNSSSYFTIGTQNGTAIQFGPTNTLISGNVGIGNTSPSAKLDVTGAIISSGTYQARMIGAAGGAYFGSMSSVPVIFQVNQNEVARFDSGGNLGIGTSTPSYKLDVSGTGRFVNQLRVYSLLSDNQIKGSSYVELSPDQTTYNAWNIRVGAQAADNCYYITGGGVNILTTEGYSNPYTVKLYSNGAQTLTMTNSAIKFNAYGSGSFTGTATQKLAVDGSGNIIEIPIGAGPVDGSGTTNFVTKWTDSDTIGNSQIFDNGTNIGIGTSSPSQKLDVNGVAKANSFTFNASSGSGNWQIGSDSSIDSGKGMYIYNSLGDYRISIKENGNVGIGTTNPDVKFQVQGGTIKATTGDYASPSTGGAISMFQDNNDYGTIWSVKNYNGAWGNIAIAPLGGNVGIGTSSPSSLLEIAGSAPVLTMNRLSGSFTNTIDFKASGNPVGSIISNSATGEQRYSIGPSAGWGGFQTFYTDTSERMRINSVGNVGIGTSSPARLLELSAGEPTLRFNPTSVSGAYIFTAADGKFYFTPESTYVSTMTFSSGNVGIGTTSPTQKLDVVGNAKVSGSVQVGDDSATASATNVGATRYRSDANNSYMDMVMQTGSGVYQWVNIVQNTW